MTISLATHPARALRLAAAVAAGAASAAAAVPARAQANYSLHAVGSVTGAWTDNILGAADDPGAGQAGPEASFYTQIRPSGLLTVETPRTVQILSYALDLNLFQADSSPTSINHTGRWNGLFQTSPLSEISLGASLGVGTVSTALVAGDPAQALDPQRQGGTRFTSLGAVQGYRWQLSNDWRLTQGASYTQVDTRLEQDNTETNAVTFGGAAGLDRTWARTSLGLALSASYVDLVTPGAAAGETEQQTQVNSTLAAQWRRDISVSWAARASLGVGGVFALDGAQFPALFTGVGSAALSYFRRLGLVTGTFGVSVNRGVAPNLFVATNTVSEGVAVNAGVPLPWFRRGQQFTAQVAGSVGAQCFETIDLNTSSSQSPSCFGALSGDGGGAQARFALYTADLAVIWSPRDAWTLALRYQLVVQAGDSQELPTQVADFSRNTILVTVAGRFPDRVAAQMPDRSGQRVDRSDETPVGDEQQSAGEGRPRPGRL